VLCRMKEYHKIQTIFKRDMTQKKAPLILGEYSLPEFEYLKDNLWVFTEKVDGTCIRVMWDGEKVTFGGKTDNAQMPVFLLYKLQELFEGDEKRYHFVKQFGVSADDPVQVCLYGEGYGARIQKGGGNYIPDGVSFVLFDVKIGEWWLQRADIEEIAHTFDLKIVPVIGEGTLSDAVEFAKKGFPSQWGDFLAEGIVLRPKTELRTRAGHRIITKIKHRDF
jgi:hypothetical protein